METRCPECDAIVRGTTCIICGRKVTAPAGSAGGPSKIPHCVYCGNPVLGAKSLYTICRACKGDEPADAPNPVDVKALVREVLAKVSAPSKLDQRQSVAPPHVTRYHAERLMRRGLEETAAWRTAEAMVQDPEHVGRCDVCLGVSDGS